MADCVYTLKEKLRVALEKDLKSEINYSQTLLANPL